MISSTPPSVRCPSLDLSAYRSCNSGARLSSTATRRPRRGSGCAGTGTRPLGPPRVWCGRISSLRVREERFGPTRPRSPARAPRPPRREDVPDDGRAVDHGRSAGATVRAGRRAGPRSSGGWRPSVRSSVAAPTGPCWSAGAVVDQHRRGSPRRTAGCLPRRRRCAPRLGGEFGAPGRPVASTSLPRSEAAPTDDDAFNLPPPRRAVPRGNPAAPGTGASSGRPPPSLRGAR